MKKVIFLIVAIILTGSVFFAYVSLGGFPIGFRNGRLVIYQYFCSDVCPQSGSWHKEYYGIDTQEECEKIGGYSYLDPAWSSFVGCLPQ